MPPKKVSFKAPAALSSPSNPTAPPDDPAARLRSLLTNAKPLSRDVDSAPPAPALPTLPSIPAVAALQAEVAELKHERDTLTSVYREKSSEFKELLRSHNALQDKLARLTEQLARVSAQVTSTVAASAAAAPEPLPRLLTKDLASCAVQTDPIMPTADVAPKPPVKKSFAQAAKALGSKPTVRPDRAMTPTRTQPLAPDSASSDHAHSPFKGRRATKPNELHVQLQSRAAFNNALLEYSSLKLNHRHALLDAFVNAVSAKITGKTRSYFLDNHIEATFWSPRGNLIIRTKRAPSVQLHGLLLDTIEMLCGGKKFVVLTRPTLSLLKLCKVPTRYSDGSVVDAELIASELFHDSRITNASFWHLPRFVSYKGSPPGRTATLFFSLVDSPQYALGRSLVNTTVSIFGTDFKVLRWIPAVHDQQTMNIALGGPAFYKERLPIITTSSNITVPSRPSTTTPTPTIPSSLPSVTAIPRTLKPLSPRTGASPSLTHLRAALAAHSDVKRDYPNLFISYDP
ncbi:hypothetical protein AX14_006340 [Amanita brunnescens Koide BX004]|nr:hypothetical protein AX14_006340 [Amanita brunnescens Koide BX004]